MPVKTFFLASFLFGGSGRRADFHGQDYTWSVRKYSISLFHVLKLYNLPPLFSNFIFYGALKWGRSAVNRSKCEKSILRKRVYSFKHSGNSWGNHRGPEKVCSDWWSGLKRSEFVLQGHGPHEENIIGDMTKGVVRTPFLRNHEGRYIEAAGW